MRVRQSSGMKIDFITVFVSGLGSNAGSVKFVHPSLKLRISAVLKVDPKQSSTPHIKNNIFNFRATAFLIQRDMSFKSE